MVIERLNPFWNKYFDNIILNNNSHLIVAHSNSLRAIVKILENLSNEEIMNVNIPTGVPLVYTFNKDKEIVEKKYLIDNEELEKKQDLIKNQRNSSMSFNFNDVKVLLIGDFMIDQYVLCSSTRMSPEAPVPVLKPEKIYSTPGGAGNVAINLAALGARVTCIGTIGSDENGKELTGLLLQKNINIDQLYITDLPTTSKKRYYLNGKQVLRVDIEEVNEDWSPKKTDFNDEEYDIVILSDYNKGVLNNKWFSKIKAKNIFVDPKKTIFHFYSNATIITPNLNEFRIYFS